MKDMIDGLQKLLPWVAGLSLAPKVIISAIIILLALLLLILIWKPTPPSESLKQEPKLTISKNEKEGNQKLNLTNQQGAKPESQSQMPPKTLKVKSKVMEPKIETERNQKPTLEKEQGIGSASPIESQSRIEGNIISMYANAKSLSLTFDRDSAINDIIDYALKNNRADLALNYLSELSLTIDRDNAYKRIMEHYLSAGKCDLAEKLVEKLSITSDRDAYRKKIIAARKKL